ncbi:MAG: amidohydrolase [Candidatus Micrarchaeota archaeon]
MSLLIKNATMLNKVEMDIYVEDNLISEIGKNLKKKADETIDAKGKIAMPGFMNAHTHVPMTLFRGYGEGLPLDRWLNDKIWPAEAKLKPNDVYWGSVLGMCEMIRSGITTFNEMYITGMDEICKACGNVGMRGAIARGTLDGLPHKKFEDEYREATGFTKKWKNKSELITPIMSAHSIYATSEEMLVKLKEFATKEGLKYHIHLSETRTEIFDCLNKHKKYPFEYLDVLGILDQDTIIAHGSWATTKEIKLAGKRKANIATCPISNLKLASGGICPTSEYCEHGANVCIGTDGAASNNSLNMFESVKLASLLQKHRYWKANTLSVDTVFDFATKNGAKALGINAGELKPGKLADIVLLDAGMANMRPMENIKANIIYSTNPGNVNDVIINGKPVMKDKKIVTVDEKEAIAKVEKSFEGLKI